MWVYLQQVFDRLHPELSIHRNLNAETEEMLSQPLPLYRNFDAHAVFDVIIVIDDNIS